MPTTMHQKVSYVNGAGNIQNIFNGADKEKDTSITSDLWRAEKHLEKGCLQFIEHVTLPTKLRSCIYFISKKENGASLVAQWLRICLLMQGTRVRALVWEDPACHGAAGPVSHNY